MARGAVAVEDRGDVAGERDSVGGEVRSRCGVAGRREVADDGDPQRGQHGEASADNVHGERLLPAPSSRNRWRAGPNVESRASACR